MVISLEPFGIQAYNLDFLFSLKSQEFCQVWSNCEVVGVKVLIFVLLLYRITLLEVFIFNLHLKMSSSTFSRYFAHKE